MICPNCGHLNRENAKFCEECGIVLPTNVPGSTPSEPAPTARAPYRAPRSTEPFHANPSSAESGAPPSGTTMLGGLGAGSNRGRQIFALLALALIFLLCCCCGLTILAFYSLTQTPGTSLLGVI